MINMEVFKIQDVSLFKSEYRLAWHCDGQECVAGVNIDDDALLKSFDPQEYLFKTLDFTLKAVIRGMHGDEDCNWCDSAVYSLSVIAKHANNGQQAPMPFWKSSPFADFGAVSISKEAPVHQGQDESRRLSQEAWGLPGAHELLRYPCPCYATDAHLRTIIIHLNDDHKWTREAIADWLDSIDDPENGIDLAFKMSEKEES